MDFKKRVESRILEFFSFVVTISLFFSDWGFIYKTGRRPLIPIPEIVAVFFIIIWWCSKTITINLSFSKEAIFFFMLIISIVFVASAGAIWNYSSVNFFEHCKSSSRLIFWAVFLLAWIDGAKKNILDKNLGKKIWSLYRTGAILISIIAILQFLIGSLAGIHLNLHPFLQQSWGSMMGHYRATGIYSEPSWLGTVLLPPLIAQGTLLLIRKEIKCFWSFLIIFLGLSVSLSLGSFIVLAIWFGLILLKEVVKFPRPRINVKKFRFALIIFTLLLLTIFPLSFKVYPLLIKRIRIDTKNVSRALAKEPVPLTSTIKRLSSYQGFIAVMKISPIVGVGFDQKDLITKMMGRYFESTTSGIFGFIGTSSGLLGVILLLMIFFLAAGGLEKNLDRKNTKIIGEAIIGTLLLEQTILYSGILNADFWIPLAIGVLLTSPSEGSLYTNKIKQYLKFYE